MLLIAIDKPTVDARLGISLDATPEGRVMVSRVSSTGLFARSKLTVGMEIVMVNDRLCNGLREVSAAMQQGQGRLTLAVIEPPDRGEPRAPRPSQRKPPRQSTTRTATSTTSRVQEDADPGAVEILLDPQRQPPPPPPPPRGGPLRKISSSSPSSSFGKSKKKNTLTILVPHVPKLGVRLQQDNRHVVVKQINPDSVFADTELQPGMRVISMNDYDCVGANVEQVSQLFRQEPREDGLLTLVVQHRQGSSLSRSSSFNGQRSNASSEENHPDSNNNNPAIPDDLSERFQRYKSVRSTQQIQQPPPPPKKKSSSSSSLVRASVNKSSASQPTGLRLKESPDRRHVRIDRLQPDSPFGRTALRIGMTVRRINGIDCTGLSVQQVAQLVRETQGTLTIEASPAKAETQQPRRA